MKQLISVGLAALALAALHTPIEAAPRGGPSPRPGPSVGTPIAPKTVSLPVKVNGIKPAGLVPGPGKAKVPDIKPLPKVKPAAVTPLPAKTITKNYHVKHGVKFSHGFFYKGKHHKHWSHQWYCKKFACWMYYCPCTCVWYYYHPTLVIYYPVTYLPVCPPVTVLPDDPDLVEVPAPLPDVPVVPAETPAPPEVPVEE